MSTQRAADGTRGLHSVMAERIAEVRQARELSARALAERCAGLGMPSLNRSVIANIEAQRRQIGVTVPELLVLARALDVAPVYLMLPLDPGAQVEVVPGQEMTAEDAWNWVAGLVAPDGVDAKLFMEQTPSSNGVLEDLVNRVIDKAVAPLHDDMARALRLLAEGENEAAVAVFASDEERDQ